MNTTTKQKKPLFAVGETVNIPPDLYGKTSGVIYRIGKLFGEVENNRFVAGGGNIEEDTIKDIQLPYKFDGETLTIDYPETDYTNCIVKAYTNTYKFRCYSYTVAMEKYGVGLKESTLVRYNKKPAK